MNSCALEADARCVSDRRTRRCRDRRGRRDRRPSGRGSRRGTCGQRSAGARGRPCAPPRRRRSRPRAAAPRQAGGSRATGARSPTSTDARVRVLGPLDREQQRRCSRPAARWCARRVPASAATNTTVSPRSRPRRISATQSGDTAVELQRRLTGDVPRASFVADRQRLERSSQSTARRRQPPSRSPARTAAARACLCSVRPRSWRSPARAPSHPAHALRRAPRRARYRPDCVEIVEEARAAIG